MQVKIHRRPKNRSMKNITGKQPIKIELWGAEGDGTILQLNIVFDGDNLNWIQCDICDKWYHYICVGLDEMENFDEEEWMCPNC